MACSGMEKVDLPENSKIAKVKNHVINYLMNLFSSSPYALLSLKINSDHQ